MRLCRLAFVIPTILRNSTIFSAFTERPTSHRNVLAGRLPRQGGHHGARAHVVDRVVVRVARVAADMLEAHVLDLQQLDQALPQVLVLHRLAAEVSQPFRHQTCSHPLSPFTR